jgi:tripartite ATP-independent transporter DctM subunit
MTASLLAFAALFALCFLGLPLGLGMIAVGAVGLAAVRGWDAALYMMTQQVLDFTMNYGLSVLPMFILMGALIHRAGLSEDLFESARAWFGHFRGGLAQASVAACAAFGAVCGSSLATAATMGKVALPAMKRSGYDDGFACGSVAAGGTLGILIPPSVPLVIYGILTESDIAKLFIAGILPGLSLTALYMSAAWSSVVARPALARPAAPAPWSDRVKSLRRIWGVALLFLVVLGGLYQGWFTPTEGAGIGAAGALAFLLLRSGRRTFAQLRDALIESGFTTCSIMLVGAGALVFGNFLTIAGLPNAMIGWINSLDVPPIGVIIAICAIYLILGCVFDSLGMMFLTIPVFYPIVKALGFDLIWFGIIVVVVVELGLMTPPVGINVFVIKSLAPEVPMWAIFRGVAPFVVAALVCLAMMIAFPEIALVLTRYM